MTADLTARIRAKLDEMEHDKMCRAAEQANRHGRIWLCTCDRPQRVADLVRRMMEDAIRRASFWPDADVAKCAEAALAVPSEEEERG